jgi:hypothetical protein
MPGTPPLDTIAALAAMLNVQSLDLRAEYEAKLRILTTIQRQIEVLRSERSTPAQQQRALDELRRRFNDLTAANRDASETLAMIRSAFDKVDREQQRREKKRRTNVSRTAERASHAADA